MAADGHLGYTKVAITSQPVCRSTYVMFDNINRKLLILAVECRLVASMSLDLFSRGSYTYTPVVRLPLIQLGFLVFILK